MGAFADLRSTVELALHDAAEGTNWSVLPYLVDGITPPAYVIEWSDPWVPERMTTCRYRVELNVRCVVSRIADPNIETLELMVEAAAGHLEAVRLPAREVAQPTPWINGNITYLTALMLVPSTVGISAPAALATN